MKRINAIPVEVILFITIIVTSDCSLMGLEDVVEVECTDNSTCAPLNENLPDDACMVYQCAQDGIGCVLSPKDSDGDNAIDARCESYREDPEQELDCDDTTKSRAPGNDEICDGLDNDCDLIVDEGQIVDSKAKNGIKELSVGSEPRYIVYSYSREPNIVSSREPAGVLSYQVQNQVRQVYPSDEEPISYPLEVKERACLTLDEVSDEPFINPLDCDFTEVAVSQMEYPALAAAVNVQGVDVGQLRVGYIKTLDDTSFEMPDPREDSVREPEHLSNVYLGIDVDIDGATPYSGRTHPDSPGAGRLNMASLEPAGQSPQALLVWIGDTVNRDTCGDRSDPVPVQALGLWLETVRTKPWVQASNDAVPQTVGQTRGGGRPSIAVWPRESSDGGYFVAYSDQDEQVVLHHVSVLEELPEYQSAESWSTPEIVVHDAYSFSRARSKADHVSIAPANALEKAIRPVCGPSQKGYEIGVVWQEGCGTDDAGVFFAVVGFVTATETFCLQHEVVQIARGDATKGGFIPTMIYLGEGFVEPGFERDGATATEETQGGWLVAWAAEQDGQSAIFAQRIAELDGKLLDDEPMEVSAASSYVLSYPMLYPSATNGARLVYFQKDSNQFIVRDLMFTVH